MRNPFFIAGAAFALTMAAQALASAPPAWADAAHVHDPAAVGDKIATVKRDRA